MSDLKANRYYVYTLIDPRDDKVFYVGKGSGGRINHHEAEARTNTQGNLAKIEMIREIWASGFKVKKVKISTSLSESDAYRTERELIKSIGRENLTNFSRGAVTVQEKSAILLSRLRSFDEWCEAEKPSANYIKIYHAVRDALIDLSSRVGLTQQYVGAS